MKKKEVIKTHSFQAKPYPFNVNFCLVRKNTENLEFNQAGKTLRDDFEIYIYLRQGELHLPTVMHEIFHATEFIMNAVGQKIDIQNPNEAWAYLLEEITREYEKFK